MNLRTTIISCSLFLLLSACSADAENNLSNATQNVKDQVSNVRDKDNPTVLLVKNGSFTDHPEKSIGNAFQEFFGSPTWKYFDGETGEKVVEFTGRMMYQDAEVKARLQFLIHEDDTFEVGALSFNDVPQNQLTTNQVLEAVFEPNQE